MTVNAFGSKQTQALVHESRMINMDWKFNVATVTGTSIFEVASRACIVAEWSISSIVQSTGHRVEKGIKCCRTGDPLHGESTNIFRAQKTEVDALDGRHHGLRDIHVDQVVIPQVSSKGSQLFWSPAKGSVDDRKFSSLAREFF